MGFWVKLAQFGTTSACAENTYPKIRSLQRRRNYLRVRGEYRQIIATTASMWELPPRARRIPGGGGVGGPTRGTTSACAENTLFVSAGEDLFWNYLRVRGEYSPTPGKMSLTWELPPRARRILAMVLIGYMCGGTTSACAENTSTPSMTAPRAGNYLRVRGEYSLTTLSKEILMELPPRARRIQVPCGFERTFDGTTSACAENTIYENYSY